MRLSPLSRKLHYWASALVALPVLLVIVTGLMLQVKKQVPWVQPPERRGTGTAPVVDFDRVLEACRGVPEAAVAGWDDVARMDVRPSRGLIKVSCKNGVEVQLDAGTGAVLQAAVRRSDWIESLHDGSFFSDGVKLGVFLPSCLVLLGLWLTGLVLFAAPLGVKWRRRRARRAGS